MPGEVDNGHQLGERPAQIRGGVAVQPAGSAAADEEYFKPLQFRFVVDGISGGATMTLNVSSSRRTAGFSSISMIRSGRF